MEGQHNGRTQTRGPRKIKGQLDWKAGKGLSKEEHDTGRLEGHTTEGLNPETQERRAGWEILLSWKAGEP